VNSKVPAKRGEIKKGVRGRDEAILQAIEAAKAAGYIQEETQDGRTRKYAFVSWPKDDRNLST